MMTAVWIFVLVVYFHGQVDHFCLFGERHYKNQLIYRQIISILPVTTKGDGVEEFLTVASFAMIW